MRQSTVCASCGHGLLVHLHKCGVRGCRCPGFEPAVRKSADSGLQNLETNVPDTPDKIRSTMEMKGGHK